MGSPNSASHVALLLTFALLLCSEAPTVTADKQRDPSLVIYLFEQFFDVPGTNTTDLIASPPGGKITDAVWGYLGMAEFPVRLSADPSAPVIGKSPAFFFPNKGPLNFSIYKLITLETPQYKGTIFSASDFNVPTDYSSVGEFTVSGGTGSFRDASGYIRVTAADLGTDHITFNKSIKPLPSGDVQEVDVGHEMAKYLRALILRHLLRQQSPEGILTD